MTVVLTSTTDELIYPRCAYLQELGAPKVKHELRVEGEVVRKPEAVRVVLVVLAKLLAEADEHPER